MHSFVVVVGVRALARRLLLASHFGRKKRTLCWKK